MNLDQLQLEMCKKHGAIFTPSTPEMKLGVSAGFFQSNYPLNGLRHPPQPGTCGWFLWTGENLSTNSDFFKPIHVEHLFERCPQVLPYLALPPGWRFLIAEGYEDVWWDSTLLDLSL
jgi:hypothetical protein